MLTSRPGIGWLLLAALAQCTACGSGDGGGEEAFLDYVKPYAMGCTETVCQKQTRDCTSREEQQCNDCFNSCSSPYQSDPGLCASICGDICTTSNCNSCSVPEDLCATRGIRFDPPPLNTELRDLALRALSQCDPSASADTLAHSADFYGRSFRHGFASVLECLLAKGCDADECKNVATGGTVGTALCARLQACGSPCAEGTATYIDALEPVLRPGLDAELARCSRETDCATVVACSDALRPALDLADYPTSQ